MKKLLIGLAALFSGRLGKDLPCTQIAVLRGQIKPANPTFFLLFALFILSSALIFPQAAQADTGTWAYIASMQAARVGQGVVQLDSSRLLVCGGADYSGNLKSCEIFNTTTNQWSAAADMNAARGSISMFLLANGKVLAFGGTAPGTDNAINTAELYDPALNSWQYTGNLQNGTLSHGAYQHGAVKLADGKVLIAGGRPNYPMCDSSPTTQTYDPATSLWTLAGNMNIARQVLTGASHPVLLDNGKVLVVGGQVETGCNGPSSTAKTELFDPSTRLWTFTGDMSVARFMPSVVKLADGKVLVCGGTSTFWGSYAPLKSCELYNPATGLWSATGNMINAGLVRTATLLPDGKVLVTGGFIGSSGEAPISVSEIYDPATGQWTLTSSMNDVRYNHRAVLLNDNRVIVIGGQNSSAAYNSVEAYTTLSTGLVAHYPFTGNADDASGNGNNGTVNGATLTTDRFGNVGGAYSFDGTSNYIDAGLLPTLGNNPTALTECAWIASANPSGSGVIMSKRHVDGNSWSTLQIWNNGSYVASISIEADYYFNGTSGTTIIDNNWHFVCGTKDNSLYKLYFDGVLEGQTTDSRVISSTSNMHIGHHGMWDRWFYGKIDDVRIYNRALSSAEVQTLYTESSPTGSVTLALTKSGTGSGNVTSDSGTISWTTNTSTATYNSGTTVTLTAVADASSVFSGWSGACTNTTGACIVTMNAAKSVTATFNLAPIISITPASPVNFGSVAVQANQNAVIQIYNTGASPLHVSSITDGSSPDFFYKYADFGSAKACGGTTPTIAVGDYCEIQATFKPQSTGAKSCWLTIISNDPLNPTVVHTFSGTGILSTQTIGAITFTPSTLAVGGSATAAATATSGLTVTFSSTTPGVCTVNGTTITALATGTCTIAANQAGDANYSAATQVTQSIFVIKKAVARFAYVANATSNTVSIYTVDSTTGALRHNGYAATGTYPVSVAVDPSGRFAYVVNSSSNDVSVYTINPATGALTAGTAVAAGVQPMSVAVDPSGRFVYVGNYNDASNSISIYTINQSTGALTAVGTPVAAGQSPGTVVVDPTGRFVYVGNNIANTVSVFSINQTTGELTAGTPVAATNPGGLTADPTGRFVYVATTSANSVKVYTINQSTGALNAGTAVAAGTAPYGVAVDPSGKFAYAANIGSNNVSVYTINQSTGALTAGTAVAAGTQPLSVAVDPSGMFVYVNNFGSNDVSIYTINQTTGALTFSRSISAQQGPYSVALVNGSAPVSYVPKFAYVANLVSNDVSVYTIDSVTGALTAGTTVAAGANPQWVTVDPFGRFAYAANHDSGNISVYTINQTTGALAAGTAVAVVSTPTRPSVDPSGRFLYVPSQDLGSSTDGTVSVYSINQTTGELTAVGTPVAAGRNPAMVAIDPSGKFAYVANYLSSTVSIFTINQITGVLTAVSTAATGNGPMSLAVDPSGKFTYVANAGSNTVSVYTINQSTGALTAGTAVAAGSGSYDVAVDPSGKFVYVTNISSNNISIYSIDQTTGALTPVDTTVSTGTMPYFVAIDPTGKNVYVTNYGSNNVSVYAINQATGALTAKGTVANGSAPSSITITGGIYTRLGGSIQGTAINVEPAYVSTLAGSAGAIGSADGTGSAARFNFTGGITTDGTNIYVTDHWNQTIRKVVIATGAVTTFAGSAGVIGSVDGTGTEALFYGPGDITTDGTNLYVAEAYNQMIRKIVIATGVVTTIAGSPGVYGSADGTGSAARFWAPLGITTYGKNLYVSDAANHTIRKVVIATGEVTTFAGTAGQAGTDDGIGAAARFYSPRYIATDGTNLYVADMGNHTIRKIVIATGEVTTVAGSAGVPGSADGVGTAAQFNQPHGVTTDGTNLYIGDTVNDTIRKIVIATGAVTTLAGSAQLTESTDGAGAVARFYYPTGITTDGTNLYVSDNSNHTIRKITRAKTVTPTAGTGGSISPSTAQTIASGANVPFTVTPNTGYTASVSGCGGTLTGNTYTTSAIAVDCTVTASFTLNTPNTFSFTDLSGVSLNGTATSETITISGLTASAIISITGGTYSINSGAYTSASGTVNSGDTVTVRLTTSAAFSRAVLTIGGVSASFSARTTAGMPRFAYVANYDSNTVSIYTVDSNTGALRHNGYVMAGTNPQTVTVHTSGKYAYVTNYGSANISVYSINQTTGALTAVGTPVAAGALPYSVTVDPSGRFLYVTNIDPWQVSVYTINQTTGALTVGTTAATGRYAYEISIDPSGRFAYVATGWGNTWVYTIDQTTGALTNVTTVAAGTYQTGVTVDPTGKFAYVVAASSGTVTSFAVNQTTGALTDGAAVATGTNPFQVTVDPSSRFAYVTNYGANSVSVYTINQATGALTAGTTVAAGTQPRGVKVDPSGKFAYVTNQGSNDVYVYAIDQSTGALTLSRTILAQLTPFSISLVNGSAPVTYSPKFAYVANPVSNDISVYTIGSVTGALTAGTTVAAGANPQWVAVDPFGRFAYAANQASGNISVYTINQTTGALTAGSVVAVVSNPHRPTVDPEGRFLYVPCVIPGTSIDGTVSVYSINQTTGDLTAVGSPVTSGGINPAMVTIDPSGKFAYVTNNVSRTVSAFTINQITGDLTAVGTVATGADPVGLAVDPSGKFAYVANGSSQNVSVYTINQSTGALTAGTAVAAGSGSYDVAVDPSGKFVYVTNISSNNISIYSIDQTTGALTPVDTTVSTGTMPYFVAIDPSGKNAYVTNYGSNNVSVYAINQTTGALTAKGTVANGSAPSSITITGSISTDDLTSGLVAWYPFNGNANDASGNGNNGTVNGATPIPDRFGNANGAYGFNGASNYILVGDPTPTSLQIQNEITLAAWIFATQYPNNDLGLIAGSQYDPHVAGASIFLDGRTSPDGQTSPAGHIHFQIGDGAWHTTNVNAQVPLNQWVHILATRKANEDAKVYYNGVLQPLTSIAWSGNISYSGTMFAVGRQKSPDIRFFDGKIDDVRIYNRALSSAEVQMLYSESSPTGTVTITLTKTGTGSGNVDPSRGTISWDSNSGTATYSSGTTVTFSAIPDNGSVFSGWSGACTNATGNCTVTMDVAKSVTALFDPAPNLTTGLVAYYPFSGNADDASGNGNNGTVYGATLSTDRFGNANKAYSFNGSSDYIMTGSLSFPSMGDSERTVSAWFKTTRSDGIVVSVGYGPYTDNVTYAIAPRSDGIELYGSLSQNDRLFPSSTGYLDDNWHHVVVTKKNDRSYLYMDGNYVSETSPHVWNTNNSSIMIGQWSDWNRYFQGSIDDVRIYNRTLSSAEVQMLYTEAATSPNAPTNITATAGNTQATISFAAPASNGGIPITSYTVTSSPGSVTATGTASPIIVTGLANGTAYTFNVTATNAIGTSPASAASNSVTPAVPSFTITATATGGNATITCPSSGLYGTSAVCIGAVDSDYVTLVSGCGGTPAKITGTSYTYNTGTLTSDCTITATSVDSATFNSTFGGVGNAAASLAPGTASVPYINGEGYSYGNAVVIDALGRSVVTGHLNSKLFVARYKTDLTLDNSCGADNIQPCLVTFENVGNYSEGSALAIDSLGRIVVTGYGNNNGHNVPIILRYTPDLVLDQTFGSMGVTFSPADGDSYSYGMVIDSTDNIYIAGTMSDDAFVQKYDSNGSIVSTFGVSGTARYDYNSAYAGVSDIKLDVDGNIVMVGHTYGVSSNDLLLLKYTPLGVLISANLHDITTTIDDFGKALAIDSSNRIVVTGVTTRANGNGNGRDLFVARFNPDGAALDTTFGEVVSDNVRSGVVRFDAGFGLNPDNYNEGRSIAVQSDDKIVVAGYVERPDTKALALRYNTDGTPDNTFGINGAVLLANSNQYTSGYIYGMAIARNGVIIVTGQQGDGNRDDLLLARITNLLTITTTATGGNATISCSTSSVPYGTSAVCSVNVTPGYVALVSGCGGTPAKITGTGYNYNTGALTSDCTITATSVESTTFISTFGGVGNAAASLAPGTAGVPYISGDSYSYGNAVVIDALGRSVVTGFLDNMLFLARYKTDLTLDNSCGADNIQPCLVTFIYNDDDTEGTSLAIDSLGRIVVTGSGYNNNGYTVPIILRYTPDLVLDGSFGSMGVTFSPVNEYGYSHGIVIDVTDNIYIAGEMSSDAFVQKYDSHGSIVSTFGVSGTARYDNDGNYAGATDIKLDAGGNIVMVVNKSGVGSDDLLLLKYTPLGVLISANLHDITTTFDDEGKSLAIDSLNRIVVTGVTRRANDNGSDLFVARFIPDGTALDTTFGEVVDGGVRSGVVRFDAGYGLNPDNYNEGTAIALQPDYKIVVAGYVEGSDTKALALRYNPDGTPDSSFGVNGAVIRANSYPYTWGYVYGMAIARNGVIMVTGQHGDSGNREDLLLARITLPTITTTATGGNASISCQSSSVPYGTSTVCSVNVTPGYVALVSGCGGTPAKITGTSYTYNTGTLTSDCTITATSVDSTTFNSTFGGVGNAAASLAPGTASVPYISGDSRSRGNAVVIDALGRSVVTGLLDNKLFVARYKTDLTLDNSCGTDNIQPCLVTFEYNGDDTEGTALAIDSLGRIVVTGSGYNNNYNNGPVPIILRYTPDLVLDGSFGSMGVTFTPIDEESNSYGMVIDAFDNVYIAGEMYDSVGGSYDAFVQKYDSHGSIVSDFGFSGTGTARYDNDGANDVVNDIKFDADGNIVMVGNTSGVLLLLKYDPLGVLISDDLYDITSTNEDEGKALAIDSSNNIVVTGVTRRDNDAGYDLFVARFSSHETGTALDETFGEVVDGDVRSGVVRFDAGFGLIPGSYNEGTAIALQPDDKIVVAGYVEGSDDSKVLALRYNTDGTPDSSFGVNGAAIRANSYPYTWGYVYGMAIARDGVIIVTGEQEDDYGDKDDLLLARIDTQIVLGAPTDVTAVAGNAQATISFTAPVTSGSGPIVGYTVTSSPDGLTGTGPSSPIMVTGLTNGTDYTFTVTATYAIGTSSASAASNIVTPAGSDTLSLFTSGSGTGSISSDPAGISCGATCTASFAAGQSVVLTAMADSGSSFVGWSGCDITSGNQCTVAVTGAKSVTAMFDLITVITPPNAPTVTSTAALTNNTTPTWTWTSGGNGGNGAYRYKLDSGDLTNGATETTTYSYTPATALADGVHTLYVQERDAAGNWSVSGSFAVTVDTAGPVGVGVTTSLLDISNWDITLGTASMNNGQLTVGDQSPGGEVIRSKQSYNQPFTFTWKGYFPTSSLSSAGAGIGQEPFEAGEGQPTYNTYTFVSAWNRDFLITNPNEQAVNDAVVNNNSYYGEYTISWQNNTITWYFNGSKIRELPCVSSSPMYLYFIDYDRPFIIESASIKTGTGTAITINSAATTTKTTSVTLTHTATDPNGVATMIIGNTSDLSDGTEETYAISKAWTLTIGDGTKTVYVKFKDNAGNWSSVYSASITLDITAPDAPIIGTATEGNAQATVTFTAPTYDGGAAITGYTVTSNPAGGVDSNAGTTGLSHIITGLANGIAYTFTVTATNAIGTSLASAASNSVTPAAPPPTTYPLSLTKSGSGTGVVTSTSPDSTISCGSSCSNSYTIGATVTLTVTPDSGSIFTGWYGACSGSVTTCQVTMDDKKYISAGFRKMALSAGTSHSVELRNDGTVWAAGRNNRGQLGNGTTTNSSTPVQVSGLSGVIAISAGSEHTVALKYDGTVWAWGYNGAGQLGDGTTTSRSTPVQVKGVGGTGTLSGVTAIAAGNDHTQALKNDGTVWGWGPSSYGQLGIGTTNGSASPVQVKDAGGTGTLSGVTAIAAGHYYSAALKGDGTVWTWGGNSSGQLGDGSSGIGIQKELPVQVKGIGGSGFLSDVTAIAIGDDGFNDGHTLALKSDGTVWAWGSNYFGQLGNGTYTDLDNPILTSTPVQVVGVDGSGVLADITSIYAGTYYSMAINKDGAAFVWGWNSSGQFGYVTVPSYPDYYSITPVQISGLPVASALATGASHVISMKNDGTVLAWGDNAYGQFGNGTTTNSPTPLMTSFSGLVAVQTIGAISFTPPTVVSGGTTIASATATSGLGVVYTSITPNVCSVNGAIITAAAPGTCTITANQSGNVAFGAAAQVTGNLTVTPPITVPGAPTGVTAVAGNAQATISFTPPASNGGSQITGYTVISSPGSVTATGTASPIVVTGLVNGTSYTFTVTATNSAGTGAPSAASNSAMPITVPGAPTGVTAVAGNAQATISFIVPLSNGGSPITGYTVTSSPGGVTATGTASPIVVTGLDNGTGYTFTVTAENSAGTGSASAISNNALPVTVPGAPAGVTVVAGNAQATISFTPPVSNGGSQVTGYTVTSSPSSVTATGTASPIVVNGLVNGISYTFTVTATTSAGTSATSAASNSVTPVTVPGAPTGVTVVAGNAQATISFTPPVSNGGSPITGYTVTSSPGSVTATGTASPINVTGLVNGTSYTFTVTAINSAGTGAPSAASNTALPVTVPGAPTGVTAVAGNAQATISFTPSVSNGGSSITGYTVTSLPGNVTATGTASPIIISGLVNGTAYTFTVTATNNAGTSAPSVASNAALPVTVPGAPTGVTAAAGNAQATVSFTAPSSNGGSEITAYTVTSSPGNLTAAGTTSPIVLTGLVNGTAYKFTVTAANSTGTGAASVASNTALPVTVPAAPTDITVVAGNAQATISFTPPASNGGSPITAYTVISSPGGVTAAGIKSPIVVTGLVNGTAYKFTVTAANSAGTGATSAASNTALPVTVPAAPTAVTVPAAPTDITAVAGNAQATISFTPPASNGGSPITAYTVISSPGNVTATGTASPIIVTGLANGTSYTFTVTAANSAGTGAASAASNTALPVTVPAAPTAVTAVAANAQAIISFSEPASNGGSPITGYTVTSSPGGLTVTGTASPIIVSGLVNGTSYTFTVTAANSAGTGAASAASNTALPVTVSGAPTDIIAVAGNAQATISFTPPASNGGSPITAYTVISSQGNVTATGTASPIVVTGLVNGTSYTFTVTAANSAGTGAASAASNTALPATVPGAPTAVTAVAANAQAIISFSEPASNGGSPITGYTVTSSPGNVTATGTTSPIIISGLVNGTSYTFTVTAINSAGTGASSAASNSALPVTVPGAPTGVTAVAGNAQATISFTEPLSSGGSQITVYTVTSSPGGVIATGTSSPIIVSGLVNGTSYTFTVTATNVAGTGAGSAISNSVTPALPVSVPGTPTEVSSKAGNAQATISFTAPASNGGSPITGYTVTSSPDAVTATGIASPIIVSGLINGTAYTFTVTAANSAGTGAASAASNTAIPVTVPGTPTDVSSIAGNAQATISFTAPASNGGSQITAYTVTSSPGNITGTGTGSPITVTGLTNGTGYTFTVTASNIAGTSVASSASTSVTPVTAPGAPTGVAAVAGNAQATISFIVPTLNGGSPITGYTVTSSPGGVTATGTASPIVVSGLVNGTTYTFTVVAANNVGTGVASAASNSVTASAPPVVANGTTTTVTTNASGQNASTIALNTPGAAVNIPAGTAMADAAGNPVTGPLTMTATASTSVSSLPAAEMSGRTADGRPLRSMGGFIDINISSASGSVKRFATPITVNIALSTELAVPGVALEYFSFDGTKWNMEGTATVKADGTLDMKVSHLSIWAVAKFSSAPTGDINGDGKVDIADALKALQFAVAIGKPTATELANGDVAPLVSPVTQSNGVISATSSPNGVIDIGDAVVILQKTIGIVTW